MPELEYLGFPPKHVVEGEYEVINPLLKVVSSVVSVLIFVIVDHYDISYWFFILHCSRFFLRLFYAKVILFL